MKTQRLVLATVAVLLVGVALYFQWQHSRMRVNSSVRLALAVESYSRDYVSRGQRLPSSVTFQDLVNGGYISAREVRAFDGMKVTMYPTASTNSRTVLVRVRMPDGTQFVTLADGSVQQESRK
jgi:Flp pilus assembly protein CpaB